MEREKDNSLPFLDVLISKKEDGLNFTVYRKPTHTDIYLQADSHHHTSQLTGTMKILKYRIDPKIYRICSNKTKEEENKKIEDTFLKLGFKPNTIDKILKRSIKQ